MLISSLLESATTYSSAVRIPWINNAILLCQRYFRRDWRQTRTSDKLNSSLLRHCLVAMIFWESCIIMVIKPFYKQWAKYQAELAAYYAWNLWTRIKAIFPRQSPQDRTDDEADIEGPGKKHRGFNSRLFLIAGRARSKTTAQPLLMFRLWNPLAPKSYWTKTPRAWDI